MLNTLWSKILAFLKKVFIGETIPPEIVANNLPIQRWADIYALKASWLPNDYVGADGIKHTRRRLSLNPAKIVCAEMASLVLSERPKVEAGALVDEVFRAERFFDNEDAALEYQGALGGQAIKLYVAEGKIKLDFVRAPNFVPLAWDNSEITEAAFLDQRTDGDRVFVRVETHRRCMVAQAEGGYAESAQGVPGYRIESRAYDTKDDKEVDLAKLWPDVKPTVYVPVDEALFVYVATPEANNIDPESPLGISMFANAEDTIQALDIAFDQFVSDIELGGRRVALPGAVFRTTIDQETGKRVRYFNDADRVFVRLEGDDAEKFQPQDMTSDIRSEQFKGAIQTLLDLYAMQTGFDAGYFAFDGASVKTATEVVSENSHTYKTVNAVRNGLDFAFKHLCRVINKVGALYKLEGATEGEPNITWDDGVIDSRESRANYHISLVGAKLEDRVSALMAVHGIDEEKAQAMADKIKGETAIVVDPLGLGGGNIDGVQDQKQQGQ